jgi:hypothetical protein
MLEQKDANKGVWAYFVLTYVITLLTWGTMVVFRIPGASAASAAGPVSPFGLLLLFLGGFAPSIAGLIMTWRVAGRAGLRDLWKRASQIHFAGKWYLAILALPLLALIVRVAVQLARGGTVAESSLLIRPLGLVGFTITIILGGPLSEEFGWRGFALDRLLNRWSVWAATLILGMFWVFWHLPLFFIPGTAQESHGNFIAEFGIFVLWILALAVLFTWLYIGTGRSLFAALVFHAAVDWFGSLAGTMITNGGVIDRLVNSLVFALFAVVVLLVWRTLALKG